MSGGIFSQSNPFSIPTVVEQTTVLTGTQNDFNLLGRNVILRCNNAADLTLTGFLVNGATPRTGDLVTLVSIGVSHVYAAHQNIGSTVNGRLINYVTSGNTPLAAGKGVSSYQYDGTTLKWRLISHNQGDFISIPYDATDFTANTGLWTVDVGDLVTFAYY